MKGSDHDDTKFRVTRYMNRILDQLIEENVANNKKQFCTTSVRNNVDTLKSWLKGQRDIYHFISDLNDDIEWLNMDISENYVTAKTQVSKGLDVIRTSDLNQQTQSKVSWCAESSGISKSAVIRLCVIKEIYQNRKSLNVARSMQVSERWLEIKSKIQLRTEKLIDELYYNFSTEYVKHKLGLQIEAKNIKIVSSHYDLLKNSDGYDIMLSYERGETVINILEQYLQNKNKTKTE